MAEAAGPDVQICYIEAPLVSVDHIRWRARRHFFCPPVVTSNGRARLLPV